MLQFNCDFEGEKMDKNISRLLISICLLIVMFNAFIIINIVKKNNNLLNEKQNIFKNSFNAVSHIDETDALEIFYGQLTAYGADCYGCSGITASGYDIRNGNIYYEDKEYGKVRVVASDRNYKFGTIVRISNLKFYDEPIIAIVLDRGFLIKGDIMDLAFDTVKNPDVKNLGREKNAKFEILRYGW